jgi:leader peptidase (prepilin peptidase)/N-methyltransferase
MRAVAITKMAIIFCFYIMGAYATTDILRLLKGSQLSVWDKNCYCPVCKEQIRLIDQIPIISYIISKGRCRKCNSKIPLSDLWLEAVIFIALSGYSIAYDFSYNSLVVSIVFYEMLKIFCCAIYGVRDNDFFKNFIVSLLVNIAIFGLLAILFLIEHLV